MAISRSDGGAHGAPLPTPPDESIQQSSGGASLKVPSTLKTSAPKLAADGVEITRAQSATGSSPAKRPGPSMPKGGQAVSSASAPLLDRTPLTVGKDQHDTATTLVHCGGTQAIDVKTQEMCIKLKKLTKHEQGFKTFMIVKPKEDWHALSCHDKSQSPAAPVEHSILANNLLGHLKNTYSKVPTEQMTPEREANKARHKPLMVSHFAAPKDGSQTPLGFVFAGTRLCEIAPQSYLLRPSERYGFNPDALGDAAILAVAKLHAGLLRGSGIEGESLQCDAKHPQMQVLVNAIKAQLAVG